MRLKKFKNTMTDTLTIYREEKCMMNMDRSIIVWMRL